MRGAARAMACGALVGGLLSAGPARGHAGGPLAGIDLHLREDGGGLLETSFGLLTRQAGQDGAQGSWQGSWRWICHESITTAEATIAPRYARDADGVLLGVVGDPDQAGLEGRTLYRSVDGGCAWAAVEALAGVPVTMVVTHPSRAGAWLVAAGAQALFTTDAGASWTPSLDAGEGGVISSVHLADDGGVWAAGRSPDGRLLLARADELEGAWTSHLHAPPEGVEGASLAVLAATGDRAWLAAGATLDDRLWTTEDGGATVVEALRLEGDLVDGGLEPDGRPWVLENGRAVWRAADDGVFQPVAGWPGVGMQVHTGGAWVTSFADLTGSLVVQVSPQGAVEHAIGPLDLDGPLTCIEGTAGRDVCQPLWATVQANLEAWQPATGDSGGDGGAGDGGEGDGGEGDGGEGDGGEGDGGCGCGAAGGPAGDAASGPGLMGMLGMLGMLGLMIRRRRDPASQAATPAPGARPPSP